MYLKKKSLSFCNEVQTHCEKNIHILQATGNQKMEKAWDALRNIRAISAICLAFSTFTQSTVITEKLSCCKS